MSEVTLTITVSKKDTTYSKLEPIHTEKIILMSCKQQKPATVTFSNSMTIPGVYGDYSSHNVGITLSIPTTEEELDNFESVCDDYLQRSHVYIRNVINNICVAQGKPAPFVEAPEGVDADEDATGTIEL